MGTDPSARPVPGIEGGLRGSPLPVLALDPWAQSDQSRPLVVVGIAAGVILAVVGGDARADVKLPGIFKSHMVLQRDTPAPVWGWAEPGEKVSVRIAGQTKTATAGEDRRWKVKLDPLKAGGPHTMIITGGNHMTLDDVLVGEVWLCSGQSNMAMRKHEG